MRQQQSESKHDKFVRLAEARTNKIIDTLQLLGNCANTSVYAYTEGEVEEIFRAITEELEAAKRKFGSASAAKQAKFRLSKGGR
jgi:hypothetical protein